MNTFKERSSRRKISVFIVSIVGLAALSLALASPAVGAQASPESSGDKKLDLKWLGTAGWEIRVGDTVILIDPFITRGEASAGKEWKTNEEAVTKAIDRADYIFAGHSHADHIADIPFIAKKFGSKVIGSRTTTNIALTGGVDKSQLTTISGGEKFDFKDFSVQVVDSEHGILIRGGRRRQPKFEEVTRPWSGPITGDAFVEGGSYLYYFTFGKQRLLHQSTGGFLEHKLAGLRPEIALLYPMQEGVETMLKLLRPSTVVVHHFDQWRTPFSDGIPKDNMKRAEIFAIRVTDFDSRIRVVIPRFFENPLRP